MPRLLPSLRGVRVAILLCLLLAGCTGHPRPVASPEALVVAFADEFHSGVVLARAEVPARLLPPDLDQPWVVIHFGERRWISGEADGCLDAISLALTTGDGGVQIDGVDWWVHSRGGTEVGNERVWPFPVSRAELDSLRARLNSWVAPDAIAHPLRPGSCWWPSSRAWSLRTNCHDFTADLLAGAGIELARPPIMLAGSVRGSLDQAWAERDGGR